MANIRIDLPSELQNGQTITFKAPCACNSVTGLKVYASNTTQTFSFRDAHCNDLTGISDLFATGAYVTVVLDTDNGYAFLQNADLNKYLRDKTTPVDNLTSTSTTLPLSANQGRIMKQAFQDGCNTIVGGCTAYGVTPKSNSPADIVTAIGDVYEKGKHFAEPILLGTLTGDGTISATGISGYANLTVDNFLLKDAGYKVVKSAWSYQTIAINATVPAPTLRYSNGVLTVSGLSKTWYIGKNGDSGDHNSYCTVTPIVKVYVVR